jgi:hypothetical protein
MTMISHIITQCGGLILWKAKCQDCTSRSSWEAEIMMWNIKRIQPWPWVWFLDGLVLRIMLNFDQSFEVYNIYITNINQRKKGQLYWEHTTDFFLSIINVNRKKLKQKIACKIESKLLLNIWSWLVICAQPRLNLSLWSIKPFPHQF